jgi:hypothetical protein
MMVTAQQIRYIPLSIFHKFQKNANSPAASTGAIFNSTVDATPVLTAEEGVGVAEGDDGVVEVAFEVAITELDV